MARKSNHYINNQALYESLKEHQARTRAADLAGVPHPEMPRYVGDALEMICNRMGTRFNFVGYSYRDEMVRDAIVDCVAAVRNFDCDRFDRPYSYFSMIGWRAMVRRIFNEKRETYVKHKSFILSIMEADPDSPWTDPRAVRRSERDAAGQGASSNGTLGVSDSVIGDFEDLLAKRKAKKEDKEREKTDAS